MAGWYRRSGDVITLTLHVQPGANRSEISGLHGEALKLRLAAPPVEGRNEALLKFIAELFACRAVELRQGMQSRLGGGGNRRAIDPESLNLFQLTP
jgi:uncharacterized protein (TIGR00251 family)